MILISERLEHDGAFYYRETRKDGSVIWKNAWEDPIISNDIDMLEAEYQTMKSKEGWVVGGIIHLKHSNVEFNYKNTKDIKISEKALLGGSNWSPENIKPLSKTWKDPKIQKEKKARKNPPRTQSKVDEDEIKYHIGRDGSKFRRSFP